VGPICTSFERLRDLRHLVLNLVCSTAETQTAFLSLGVIDTHVVGFINNMLQEAVMEQKKILNMTNVTIYSTIMNFKWLNDVCVQARGERNKEFWNNETF